ncbi:MAG TPA: SDR family NAD(P)-dependent oxidoreductase [Lacipirellulaceae bacterium]|nr:SDR family NAD(P)-dependent oxidoreductase [Lacipirellulaceae bacterium]
MNRLLGRVAIITGASSGIGAATARCMASEGAQVVIADIDEAGGSQVVARIEQEGGQALFCKCDVSTSADVQALVEATTAQFGRLDVISNNALWLMNGIVTALQECDWDKTHAVCLRSAFLMSKYGIPAMQKRGAGCIVNTASVHSLVGFAGHSAYDAAKAGVLGLTRALAIDYAPEIRVNAILPGAILTPLWDRLGVSQEDRDNFAQLLPAKRLGTPEEVARAIVFLASDEASYITGTTLVVDGGLLARAV